MWILEHDFMRNYEGRSFGEALLFTNLRKVRLYVKARYPKMELTQTEDAPNQWSGEYNGNIIFVYKPKVDKK